ncbi:MAG: hypothetical protein ACJ77E_19645 [Gaiellaceae bacterium]
MNVSASPATLWTVELRALSSWNAARTRGGTAALVAALVCLALPAGAAAHVELAPDHVAPGSFTLFTVLSPNENTQRLTGLQLTIPPGLLVDAVADTPGFTTKVVQDQAHRVAGLSWQGGNVAPTRLALFRFSGVANSQGLLQLTGIQHFSDGSTRLWRTPVLDVADPPKASRDSLTLGLAVAALVLALLVGGALGYVLARGRRVAP